MKTVHVVLYKIAYELTKIVAVFESEEAADSFMVTETPKLKNEHAAEFGDTEWYEVEEWEVK